MRALLTALALLAVVGTAWAGSPLVRELQALSTRYNENPEKIDELKAALEKAGESQAADVDTLLALAQVCFMYGDVRATTEDEKLAAFDRGRQAAKRAIELAPRSAPAQFWYGINTGRWGQTKGIMRSLFLLPTVKDAMQTALAIDPGYAPAYALGAGISYDVPSYAVRPGPRQCSARAWSSPRATPPAAWASRAPSSRRAVPPTRVGSSRRCSARRPRAIPRTGR